jgi:hypothetical protein
VHLARALSDGVLGSAYIAIVLYGGVRVLRTALRAGLRSDAARHLDFVSRHGDDINRWLRRGIHAGAFAIWGFYTLAVFGVEDWALGLLGSLPARRPSSAVGVRSATLAFVLTLVGAFLLSRLLRTARTEVVRACPRPRRRTRSPPYSQCCCSFLLAIPRPADLNKVSLLAGPSAWASRPSP